MHTFIKKTWFVIQIILLVNRQYSLDDGTSILHLNKKLKKMFLTKCYSFFCTLVMAQGMSFPKKFCDVRADDLSKQCYLKETLAAMTHSPNQLAVDKATNTLYFSFDFGQGEYLPAVLNIDTKKVTVLKGVKDAFAVAHDPETKDMFFGGSHGIYRYNPKQKHLQHLTMQNLDIWWLFVKKRIYFIKFPSLNAYYYDNRTVKHVTQLRGKMVHQFVFDYDDNVFFINTTGLYGIQRDSDQPILLRDYPRFLGMAMDNKGQIYACSDDAIFVVSKMVQKVKRVVNIQGVLGLTFDKNNNMIYSNSHEIVRLVQVSNDNYYDALNTLSI